MTSQIPDYVSIGAALVPVVHALWNLPCMAAMRRRLRLRPTAAPAPPAAPRDAASAEVSALAAELLKNLPTGAVAHYEGPDGRRLTVWWIATPPTNGGHPDEYGLW